MKKLSLHKLVVAAALGAAGTMAAASGAVAADDWKAVKGDIRWASASMGSTTQVLLSGVEAVLKGVLPNVRMSVLTTSGSVENPRLLEAGETELPRHRTAPGRPRRAPSPTASRSSCRWC